MGKMRFDIVGGPADVELCWPDHWAEKEYLPAGKKGRQFAILRAFRSDLDGDCPSCGAPSWYENRGKAVRWDVLDSEVHASFCQRCRMVLFEWQYVPEDSIPDDYSPVAPD